MPEQSLKDKYDTTDQDVGKDPETLHGIPEPDFHFSASYSYMLYRQLNWT